MTELKATPDLLLINALSVALLMAVVTVPDSPLRSALGVPFILLFPGYTLVSALFPAKLAIGRLERLTLSIGLSLALVPIIGLGLNYSPWGITLTPILVSLFSFTVLMSTVAFLRRKKLPPEQKFAATLPFALPKWGAMSRNDKLFTTAILIALIAIGSFAAYLVVTPKIGERFTEFYVLGSSGTLSDYPVNLTLGQTGTVILGITNHEYQNETYTVHVSLENQTLTEIDNIQVPDNANWTQPYTFKAEKTGNAMKLEFALYKEDSDVAYRTLQLHITVRPLK